MDKETFGFGEALKKLEEGKRVCRTGWNGKGMYLRNVPNGHWGLDRDMFSDIEENNIELLPWIGMKTADNKFVPWLASQTDVKAKDWMIAE